MKERPILFSGPMVRAILEGRKTQTRRVVNSPDPLCCDPRPIRSDYEVGMRLWVREPWGIDSLGGMSGPNEYSHDYEVRYRADGFRQSFSIDGPRGVTDPYMRYFDTQRGEWRPSIHMPRWASRITLEVVKVRVERVQKISEEDARAEGVPKLDGWPKNNRQLEALLIADREGKLGTHKGAFEVLWDSINAKRGYGWDANPWVWVIEFRRIA